MLSWPTLFGLLVGGVRFSGFGAVFDPAAVTFVAWLVRKGSPVHREAGEKSPRKDDI
jgi:hypothetical protein